MTQAGRLTRRAILLLASTAGAQSWLRLYAGDKGFWNTKEPSQWTPEEIEKLTTRSPWAKPITASTPYSQGHNWDERAGVGRGRGGRSGPPPAQFHGVIRWESAKPVEEAMKTPLPAAFADHYVISVSGIPILAQRRTADGEGDSTISKGASAEALDRIQSLTYVEPKGKPAAQPDIVQTGAPRNGETNILLFGFPHDVLQLTIEDQEVAFITELGRLQLKVKFNLRDMMYLGQLAL